MYTYVMNNPLTHVDPSGHIALDSIVWVLNKQLNSLKAEWERYNSSGDIKARDVASQKSKELRDNHMVLANSLYQSRRATVGILGANDTMLAYHDIVTDAGEEMTIAVNSMGTVFYEGDFVTYDYSEQVHIQSKSENLMGRAAKAAFGYYVGVIIGKKIDPSKQVITHGSGLGGAWVTDNYLGSVPDVSDVKTMVYRTNKKTGTTENMIINTNSYNLKNWIYWKVYK